MASQQQTSRIANPKSEIANSKSEFSDSSPQISNQQSPLATADDPTAYFEPVDLVAFDFAPTRREILATLGAGMLLVIAAPLPAEAQVAPGGAGRPGGFRGGGRRGGGNTPRPVAARLHIGKDGIITVMTGKVECGQGARAEITQAAAEELRVAASSIRLIMADTQLVPDDGMTAGSRTTPSTLPAVRQGCAAARELLMRVAAKKWNIAPTKVRVADGKITADGGHQTSYADLAADEEAVKAFAGVAPQDIALTPIAEWKVLGAPLGRPNASDIVSGRHQYPSDIRRPGMLYGKVLRSPTYGGKLTAVDLGPAKALPGVIAVQDGTFAGVAAPNSAAARAALELLEKSAKWETSLQVSSKDLFDYLAKKIRGGPPKNPFAADVAKAAKSLKNDYHVAYVQHAPMETRSAVAEWTDGKLTVWTATQNPSGVRGELARAFRLSDDKVRVIVPDFGGGFGGKHSGECAVEAARLAQAAGKPVSLQWTREEEFTWAYFRPSALIQTEASLDDQGNIASWFFVNVNSGGSAVETPYRIAKNRCFSVQSDAPLRHGSYRALASTANMFARESLMDELALLAGKDPLAFRLAQLDNPRLRAVLEEAAKQFDWSKRFAARREPGYGLGLSCGTEKGSFVAACVEVLVDGDKIHVRRVCQAYECGKVMNPVGLRAQIEGAIVMGLGPALREEMRFENGQMQTAAFSEYKVPRFADLPQIDVHVLDRPDLPSVGAGETPIIAVAPAIANAVYDATRQRIRRMPIRLAKADAAGAKT